MQPESAAYAKQAEAAKAVDVVLTLFPTAWWVRLHAATCCRCCCSPCVGLLAAGTGASAGRGHARTVFGMIAIVLRAAPLGAFGAMAFTIGRYGPAALGNLIGLIALLYVRPRFLSWVCSASSLDRGLLSILRYLAYIKDEILIVLGTSTWESVLPQLMEKLEWVGCSNASSVLWCRPVTPSISTAPAFT